MARCRESIVGVFFVFLFPMNFCSFRYVVPTLQQGLTVMYRTKPDEPLLWLVKLLLTSIFEISNPDFKVGRLAEEEQSRARLSTRLSTGCFIIIIISTSISTDSLPALLIDLICCELCNVQGRQISGKGILFWNKYSRCYQTHSIYMREASHYLWPVACKLKSGILNFILFGMSYIWK